MREKVLINAIDHAFDENNIENFLNKLNERGARIASLQDASSDLTDFMPGEAFGLGDRFKTSFWEEYQSLGDEERNRIDAHYKSKAAAVSGK